MKLLWFVLVIIVHLSVALVPPEFQWKAVDFAWKFNTREAAVSSGDYIPENNMPAGIARWHDKLFITIPRWKEGIPSSLNYIFLNGSQSQPLNPYPSWEHAFVSRKARRTRSNSTVVSAFRVHVDSCDRLWVVDNGVADMLTNVRQVGAPAILVFDLHENKLLHRHEFNDDVLKESSVLTGIVVENLGPCPCDSFAYIPDMGSNALIVYNLEQNDAWRIENQYFHFDPHSSVYNVGGVEFYWNDGISTAVLSPPRKGHRDIYFHPTSSTKQFRVSSKLLKDKNIPREVLFGAVEVIGDRGPLSQATAADLDLVHNVMFYSQLSRNGISCWNTEKAMTKENVPLILSDCVLLEFPNDVKIDHENNLWILSNRQSRFLYDTLNHSVVNFRILKAPASTLIKGTPCEKMSPIQKAISFIKNT
ncbi:L-dopachrome tautomerase yellow-f2-like isoform X1 [Leptidea sinapis]|uniref:L-dopachrome tautomerase yellow-f2-like isoform X1 n=1 Tax=Leptidea sinapis TaxID=189913 RepID=UPI0021C26F2E|nr:L-dopachrome tautomerase yellow-f2-like isoform X1 [Leptidea sinapis]